MPKRTRDEVKQTRDELIQALRTQVAFLHQSADLYDRGSRIEGIRLAVTLRVLLHDTRSSTSLLAQLDVKDALDFLSTGYAPVAKGGTFIGSPLAPIIMGNGIRPEHVARLHEAPREAEQRFHVWWKAPVIGAQGNLFTREDVVKALAHEEGGAHVSPEVTRKYADLRSLGTGWELRSFGTLIDPGNPALPTCRQIAFEVDVTIHEQLSDLLR